MYVISMKTYLIEYVEVESDQTSVVKEQRVLEIKWFPVPHQYSPDKD